jgi:hypothetical protein
MPIEVPQDIEDAIQRYKKDELLRGTAERTLETYESDLRYTFNYLGCSLEELDKSGLERATLPPSE